MLRIVHSHDTNQYQTNWKPAPAYLFFCLCISVLLALNNFLFYQIYDPFDVYEFVINFIWRESILKYLLLSGLYEYFIIRSIIR